MSGFTLATLPRLGGRLCLDFANTAVFDGQTLLRDYFGADNDVVLWGEREGLIQQANRRRSLVNAADLLDMAKMLRMAIRTLALDHTEPARPKARRQAIDLLNWALSQRMEVGSLSPGNMCLRWTIDPREPHWLTSPVAVSAAELLTSPAAALVKRCNGPGCGWIFLDDSRGQRRQWCSMQLCGNREKAARHFQRSKSKELSEDQRP